MLGDELRRARLKAGLSQEQLGFAAKIDRTYVSMLERDLKSPTLKTFMRLCRALKVSPSAVVRKLERADK